MGIQGLATFIKRQAGEAITIQRLTALQGRTLAIDGNVLTLRFHHSNESTHPNRILLSWYRFLRNIQSYGIQPIVVFDGSARLSAKARELARRLAVRQLLGGRARSEEARVARLTSLQEVVEQLGKVDNDERNRILNETHRIIDEAAALVVPAHAVSPTPDLDKEEQDARVLEPPSKLPIQQEEAPLSDRLASLVMSMQAAKISEEGSLSKRQLEIAQNEAKAFTRAMAVQAEVMPTLEGGGETAEDTLNALQTVLKESRLVATSYEKRSSSPSKQVVRECAEIIRAMGVPLAFTSSEVPQEAESYCSSLVFSTVADAVLSEDTDVLVYEAPLLRRIGATSREGERIDGGYVRNQFGMDKAQWIDFCLLCGSDFTQRIKGIGPVWAYKLIKEHGSIEALLALDTLSKGAKLPDDREEYLREVRIARDVFATPTPIGNVSSEDFRPGAEDPNLFSMMRGFGLDPETEAPQALVGFVDPDSPTSGGLGFASLGDSPLIVGGKFEAAPVDNLSEEVNNSGARDTPQPA